MLPTRPEPLQLAASVTVLVCTGTAEFLAASSPCTQTPLHGPPHGRRCIAVPPSMAPLDGETILLRHASPGDPAMSAPRAAPYNPKPLGAPEASRPHPTHPNVHRIPQRGSIRGGTGDVKVCRQFCPGRLEMAIARCHNSGEANHTGPSEIQIHVTPTLGWAPPINILMLHCIPAGAATSGVFLSAGFAEPLIQLSDWSQAYSVSST